MKSAICIAGIVSTLTGCANLLPAKQMEADEIFRDSADQYTIDPSDMCNVSAGSKTGVDAKSEFSKNPGTATRQADAWSIARSYLCAVRAERDAYEDQISQIKAEQPDSTKQTKQPDSKLTHLLYWQRSLAYDAIAFANMNCDYHFRDVETSRASFEFEQSSINTVASALGAGLASLNSHNRTIFNLATAATAGNGIASHYKSTVFLTPVLRKLHKKLDEPRQTVADGIKGVLKLDKMPRVAILKGKLVEYDQLCSREFLVELLAQSVDIAAYTAPGEISIQDQATAKALIKELAKNASTTEEKLVPKVIKSLWRLSARTDKDVIIAAMKNGTDSKDQGTIAQALFSGTVAANNITKLNRVIVLLRMDDDDDLDAIDAGLSNLAEKKAKVDVSAKKGTPEAQQDASKQLDAAMTNFTYSMRGRATPLKNFSEKTLDDVRVRINAVPMIR